jgi:hypothetical protein
VIGRVEDQQTEHARRIERRLRTITYHKGGQGDVQTWPGRKAIMINEYFGKLKQEII